MTETVSIVISCLSLAVSGVTAWLTLLRRGSVRMTQPTVIFFGLDRGGPPKVFLRTLLYCTAKRGRVIETMFVRVRRSESSQTFNVWVYGEHTLARGSGIYVGLEGLVCNHHFLMPKDGTQFEFLPGEYNIEVYASIVGNKKPQLLYRTQLFLSEHQAQALKDGESGVYFDWGADSGKYHGHVDKRPKSLPTTGI